ncbi:MAG TPA: hypothetical protein VGF73_01060 [Chthoniobacterales bacterium]|jgi:hypothetical protein
MADDSKPTTDSTSGLDLNAEEKYWREHHATQPHAREGTTFEHFAPAYRVGAEAAAKYPGKEFHEIEDDLALDYQKHEVGAALPWDHVRGASKAAWAKVSGTISAREPSRGIRGSI